MWKYGIHRTELAWNPMGVRMDGNGWNPCV